MGKLMKLIADFHVHTISSGHAYSTLQEYLVAAKKKKLKAFAITDHGSSMPGGPHFYHFANMRMIPREIDGIKILRGIEANIIDENGKLDISDDDIRWGDLDIVMVAMHPRVGYENQGKEKNTEVLLKAIENPYVNVIAHPGNPKYPIDIEKVVVAAKEKGVLIEINNSSPFSRPGSHESCVAFAKAVKKLGWKVVVGTDSHFSSMIGVFGDALKIIDEAGLKEEDVVNTSWARIEKYLLRKRQ